MTSTQCSVSECLIKAHTKGLCSKHYARLRRNGSVDGVRSHAPAIDRFWRFVSKTGSADCWEWVGNTHARGYGRFGVSHGVSAQAHRFSYEIANGPIPDGLLVMHSCDNRKCVNPAHLSVGTALENTHDMLRKGRGRWLHKVGEGHPNAKLTDDDVRLIRTSSESGKAIARHLGVSESIVSKVRRGTGWKHIT